MFKVIRLTIVIILFLLVVFSYNHIVSVKNIEISLLEKEIIELEHKVNEITTQALKNENSRQEVEKTQNKEIHEEYKYMFIKEGNYDVQLFSSYSIYSEDEVIYKPAFGPLAVINPFAVEQTGGIKVIEQVGNHLSRVRIEGVIPTWLLQESEATYASNYDKKYMYVKEESNIMLSPEEDSLIVNIFARGKAIKVLDEHDDWYYIHVFLSYDSNEIYKGWIKKEQLTYYDDFISPTEIEVNVINGFKTSSPELHPYGLWGRIYMETEDLYYISSFGASSFEVKKDSLEAFFNRPKE